MDRAALAAQISGCVAHGATTDLTWAQPTGAPVTVPAIVADDAPDATELDRNAGDDSAVRITIARSALAARTAAVPRSGQVFTDSTRSYRITADRTVPHHPVLTYVCTSVPRA